MKRFFTYFGFTKAERRGFSVLVLLIFSMFLLSAGYGYLKKERAMTYRLVYLENNVEETPSLTAFDPNNLAVEQWKDMGFSEKQIAVIKNYEAKGGKFYKKEDVAKIYSISNEEYARIEPYIVIKGENKERPMVYRKSAAQKKDQKEKKKRIKEIVHIERIDINGSDTTDLKTLRGIGSVLAKRVVKYRDALGGFHAISQIGEVYGISEEVFQMIRPQLQVGENGVKKLHLNTCTKQQLARHPYISYKQASLLVNYRTQHGPFADLEDLQNISVLGDDFFRKIEPYIQF
ncbi:helix-hairpin-helix domain-containing protein [Sphingobacterium sp. SGG-5]|uniref:helix-hairpin-helix domain-containing protein n=1 Tax=Sphingobacterium sp. SGG-5 TaxID=2710881 RepID=UPI0013EBA89F|nr:helix-hairpin-helix domain-containing protein [Sphingobacterium sp. SGG-5]NGM61450.1 helix-hairpin-helix domain-containing protein [Sphingobacterium sp. SGG-5]